MRDIAFSLVLAALSAISLINPFAGMMSWGWITFALPSSSLWGFATQIPANLIIAISTIIGWVLSANKFNAQADRTLILLLLLAGAIALSTAFSLDFDRSLPKAKEYMINFTFLIMILFCLNSKVRIDAFIWMMVFCICYYSVKGGFAFLISGGAYRFEGPPGTSIGDNNHLAAAFLLAIPLINYLRLHAAIRVVRNGLAALLVLTILAVLCTQSRGGFIGLVVLGGVFLWMSGRRISHIAAGLAIICLAVALASENLVSRLQSIESAHQQDTSFLGRVVSWQMHVDAALDRPLVGAGAYAIQTWPVFGIYRPASPIVDIQLQKPVAAHSIYFQVLGDHGFVAFGLYIALLWTAWRNATWVIQRAGDHPASLWMVNLASMTRVSLATFAVTGAAVSMGFYDYFLAILVLTACLKRKLEEQQDVIVGQASKRRAHRYLQQGFPTTDQQG
ncbi:MAG: putative O-glycosylation ligase, exosortase A system-associated [Geminicoccaceae bacterium]